MLLEEQSESLLLNQSQAPPLLLDGARLCCLRMPRGICCSELSGKCQDRISEGAPDSDLEATGEPGAKEQILYHVLGLAGRREGVGGGQGLLPQPLDVSPADWSHGSLAVSWSRISALFTRRTPAGITASLPTTQARPGVRSRRWKSVSCFLKRFPPKTGKWLEHVKFSLRPSV